MPISSALGSSALLPAGLGFRNAIINGDFRINQRGFTSTTTFLAYGHDRWRLSTLGDGTSTYTTQTFTLGNAIAGYEPTNYAQLVSAGQTTNASGTNLQQPIENVRTFAGQTVIISFWAKTTSGTPKVAIELVQNFGTTGSPSSSVNTYCGQVTLSTSWTRYSVTVVVPSISGKTLGTDVNSSSLNLLLWSSAGSDYNARTGSLGIQSTTVQYWGVQVEQNYQPTPFEQRPIGVELALCERYYQKCGVWHGAANNATNWLGTASARTSMRTTPSIGATGVLVVSNFYTADPQQSSLSISILSSGSDQLSICFWIFNLSGLTGGGYYGGGRSPGGVGTGNYLLLSAEL